MCFSEFDVHSVISISPHFLSPLPRPTPFSHNLSPWTLAFSLKNSRSPEATPPRSPSLTGAPLSDIFREQWTESQESWVWFCHFVCMPLSQSLVASEFRVSRQWDYLYGPRRNLRLRPQHSFLFISLLPRLLHVPFLQSPAPFPAPFSVKLQPVSDRPLFFPGSACADRRGRSLLTQLGSRSQPQRRRWGIVGEDGGRRSPPGCPGPANVT